MDFLTHCRQTYAECGLSGDGPDATEGQRDLHALFVRWVSEGWTQVQNCRADWTFMRTSTDFPVRSGEQDYPLDTTALKDGVAPDWKIPEKDALLLLNPSGMHVTLQWAPYPTFRRLFEMGYPQHSTPTHITEAPGRILRLNGKPQQDYLARFGYRRSAQILVRATDTPLIGEDYQPIIKWAAVQSYAAYDGVPDLYQHASQQYQRLYSRMTRYLLDEFDTTRDPIA